MTANDGGFTEKTTVHFDPDILRAAKHRALDERIKGLNAMVDIALRYWLRGGEAKTVPHADRFQRMLSFIRGSRDELTIRAIENNLLAFVRSVETHMGKPEGSVLAEIDADIEEEKRRSSRMAG